MTCEYQEQDIKEFNMFAPVTYELTFQLSNTFLNSAIGHHRFEYEDETGWYLAKHCNFVKVFHNFCHFEIIVDHSWTIHSIFGCQWPFPCDRKIFWPLTNLRHQHSFQKKTCEIVRKMMCQKFFILDVILECSHQDNKHTELTDILTG